MTELPCYQGQVDEKTRLMFKVGFLFTLSSGTTSVVIIMTELPYYQGQLLLSL